MMRIAARSHPADHLAIQPDGLVPDHIGIARIKNKGLEAKPPAARTLRQRAVLADEIRGLLIGDEALQPGFERPVNGAVFTPPAAKTFLQPKRIHRPRTE